MKTLKRIVYLLMVIMTYCLVSFITYFLGNFILEIFTFNYRLKLMMIAFELLFLNPTVTYFLTEKISFEKKQEKQPSVFLDE